MGIEYKDTIEAIFRDIRKETNGAVVGSMFEILGSERYTNYGVSIPAIKEIAKEYSPNTSLALELFKLDIRELKLAAVYIANPEEITMEIMDSWSHSFDSKEILENCCSLLFSKSPEALKMALKWLDSNLYAALLISSRRAHRAYMAEERDLYLKIVERITPFSKDNLFEVKCRLLAYVSSKDDIAKEYINSLQLDSNITKEIEWLSGAI